MNIAATVLAMQLAAGFKVYQVKMLAATDGRLFLYKSENSIVIGSHVLVPAVSDSQSYFRVGQIVGEAEFIDFDNPEIVGWINQGLSDPVEIQNHYRLCDQHVAKQLARNAAQKAAEEHIASLGLSAADFTYDSITASLIGETK